MHHRAVSCKRIATSFPVDTDLAAPAPAVVVVAVPAAVCNVWGRMTWGLVAHVHAAYVRMPCRLPLAAGPIKSRVLVSGRG